MNYVKVWFEKGMLHTLISDIWNFSHISVDNDNDFHINDNLSLFEIVKFASNIVKGYIEEFDDKQIYISDAMANDRDIKELMEYELNIGEGSLKPLNSVDELTNIIPSNFKDIIRDVEEYEKTKDGIVALVWLKFPYISSISGTGYFHCSSITQFEKDLQTIKPITSLDDLKEVESDNYSEFASKGVSLNQTELWNEVIDYWREQGKQIIKLKKDFIVIKSCDWDSVPNEASGYFMLNIDSEYKGEYVLIQVTGENIEDKNAIRFYIETFDGDDGCWYGLDEILDEDDFKVVAEELKKFLEIQYIIDSNEKIHTFVKNDIFNENKYNFIDLYLQLHQNEYWKCVTDTKKAKYYFNEELEDCFTIYSKEEFVNNIMIFDEKFDNVIRNALNTN